jgi:hypothetical protein
MFKLKRVYNVKGFERVAAILLVLVVMALTALV